MSILDALEYAGFLFGVLCVYWTVRQNILCWPAGLVMVSLYLVIFGANRLYSDMILQAIYIPLQVYGWWYWLRGGRDRPQPPVSRLSWTSLGGWICVTAAATVAWGYVMSKTNASFPYFDAFTTMASLVAQWLMGRKKLENWMFWIAADLVAIPIYLLKELNPTAIMYSIFLGLCVAGLISWWKSYHQEARHTDDDQAGIDAGEVRAAAPRAPIGD